ncbi:MAG: hypothetical protein IKP73_09035 [Bacteroidales bacterium]|nr:hypothetical protein [Bacteroidales bacterium]
MKLVQYFVFVLSMLMAIGASAQRGKSKAVRSNTWSIGVGGGARVNFMKITHMAADLEYIIASI